MDTLLYAELDPHEAERLTAAALDGLKDGELYLQVAASESFAFDDGRLKSASFDQSRGFGLRGVLGEVSAYAHANEISAAAIRRAAETIAVVAALRRPSRPRAPTRGSTPTPIRFRLFPSPRR
jgi:TldD protein